MNVYARLLLLWIIAGLITAGCSKNAGPLPPSEETVDNDTISFPHVMFVIEKKGTARLFTNGREIFDSVYASVYVANAASFFFENAQPPKKIQFESKDTLGIFFGDSPETYGIHKEGDIDYLYDSYPMNPFAVEDTNMVAYTINPQTGFAHEVLTGYGDYKEFRIPIFAYVRARYVIDRYDSTKTYVSVRKMSWKYNDFKESYINTVGPMDTFAIQEYELVYKKR